MPDNLSLHLSGSSKRLNSRQLMESSNETFAPNNVDLEKEYKSSQSNITTEVYEASSFEEKVSSEKPQYSSFWKKIYYEYVVVDKSILGVSILDSFMYNQDLKPVEKERRVWSWYNYCYFWLAECFNINTWQIAATGLQLGLNWWQCWITIWIGYGFVGAFVVLASRVGSAYHL